MAEPYPIDKDIPLPTRRWPSTRSRYVTTRSRFVATLERLEVGHSFFFPSAGEASSRAYLWALRKGNGWQFMVQRVTSGRNMGSRVWRAA